MMLISFLVFFFFTTKVVESVVPFYLIEPESVLMYRECSHELAYDEKYFNVVFFIDALRLHSQRVFEKEKAELVFVPSLFDLLASRRCYSKYSIQTYVNDTISLIHSLNLYPKKRHVLLIFDWRFKFFYQSQYQMIRKEYPQIVSSNFEEFHKDCEFAVPYGNNYDYSFFYDDYPDGNRTKIRRRIHYNRQIDDGKYLIPVLRNDSTSSYESFMKRKIFVEFTGTVDSRHAYRDRYLLFNSSNPFFHKSFVQPVWMTTPSTNNYWLSKRNFSAPTVDDCQINSSIDYYIENMEKYSNTLNRCRKSLNRLESQLIRENSKFSLCFRGDTLGSDCWINSILAGSIVVAIADSIDEAILWTPLKDIIPWSDLIIVMSREKFYENPIESINKLAEIPRIEIEEKLILMKKHASDLSFISPNSRLVDNLISSASKVSCSHGTNK